MVALTTRQVAVLRHLLRAEHTVTASQIASCLQMTPRIVRYDLPWIARWLENRGSSLLTRPGVGIALVSDTYSKRDLWQQMEALDEHSLVLSPDERARQLTFLLLTTDEPLAATQVAPRLGVSQPTVLNDLRQVRVWLEQNGMALVSRPNVGCQLVGSEWQRRDALVQFLREVLPVGWLLDWTTKADASPSLPLVTRLGCGGAFCTFLDSLETDICRAQVDQIMRRLELQFTDQARVSLALCMALLIHRVRQGRLPEVSPRDMAAVKSAKEFAAARQAVDELDQHLGLSIPEEDAAYLAIRLLGAGVRKTLADAVTRQDAEDIAPKVKAVLDGLLSEACVYLQPCLQVDMQLVRNLSVHLRSALHRLRFGLPIANPLLAEVKAQYPYVFEVASRACSVLEAAAGVAIPEEEVGFITMHLGAAMERMRSAAGPRKRVLIVCGEGTATAWLLASRFQAAFPEAEVVEVTSVASVSEAYVSSHGVSLVVSTVPLLATTVPVVEVSALLDQTDVARLRQALAQEPVAGSTPFRVRPDAGASLLELLRADTVALRVSARDWVDVVYAAGNLLLASGAVEPEYVEAMRGLIERHGPYVVIMPGVALLHAAPGRWVNRLCMSLVTMKRPVPFGHPRFDPVSVAVALGTLDDHSHWRPLRQVVELLNSQEVRERICGAQTKESLLELAGQQACDSTGPITQSVSQLPVT